MRDSYPDRLRSVQRHGIEVPAEAIAKVRRLYAEVGPSTQPLQLARDIWALGGELSTHRDSTAPGKVTYGVVLAADGYGPRIRFGISGGEYEVQPGSLYVIDARESHSLEYQVGRNGLIAFLAWDLPHDFTLQGFARRALKRLNQWAKTDQPFMQPGEGI